MTEGHSPRGNFIFTGIWLCISYKNGGREAIFILSVVEITYQREM